MFDSRVDTYKHIQVVQNLLGKMIADLQRRQKDHDQSKLQTPEVEYFDKYTPKLASSTYGSDEYKQFLFEMKPALDHHYANNSHHPEFGYSQEKWNPVFGYEGLYEVSNHGRIRNLKNHMLSLQLTPKGYLRVSLSKDGECKNHMVHRLVALAFLSNSENKPEVNHKNGKKDDNTLFNLEWVTKCENQCHAYENGLKQPNVKYFVHCIELDIITLGCCKMETRLKDLGYNKIAAAGIWRSMDSGGKHYDLTFVGYPISDGHPQSMVKGMNLLDLVEMLCDWKAATMRHNDGNIHKSIEMNQKRFGYTDELKQILINSLPYIQDSQLQKNENLESVVNAYMKDGVCSVTSCKLVPLSESLSEWYEALYVKLHYTIQSLSATAVTLTVSPFMAEVCKLKSQTVPGRYFAGTMGQWSVYQDSDMADGHVLIETSMGKAILMISNIDELKKVYHG